MREEASVTRLFRSIAIIMITDINECLSLSHSKLLVLIIYTRDLYGSLSIACEGQSSYADAETRRRIGRRRGASAGGGFPRPGVFCVCKQTSERVMNGKFMCDFLRLL